MDKDTLLNILAPEIEKIETTMRAEFSAINSPLLSEVVHHAIFNGGKRIRPILTILAGRLIAFCQMPKDIGTEEQIMPPDELYQLAMVFEFLHGASLLHDDVIDHAATRRGAQTVHHKWNREAAILAGDYLHTRAMTLAGTAGDQQCLTIIGAATSAMIDAEFLQAEAADKHDASEEDYFAILRGKTGALIGAACETGAVFARADSKQQQALRTFGDALGIAFQMIDDLLDYQGDSARTGKAVGNDFQEGKMTLPIIHALAEGDNADRARLRELLEGDEETRQQSLAQATAIIDRAQGFAYTRQGAETLIEAAIDALAIFPDCQARATLTAIGHYVLSRDK